MFRKFATAAVLGSLTLATGSTFAAIIVNDDTPVVITHDEDVPGVFAEGTGTANFEFRNIAEPDGFSVNNGNTQTTYLSVGASIVHKNLAFLGGTAGQNTLFVADLNGDADTVDSVSIANDQLRVRNNLDPLLVDGNAYLLTSDQDFTFTSLLLRVQNNTGATVDEWRIGADLFGEDDDNSNSTLNFVFAADNGTDPNSIAFSSFAPGVTTGNNGGVLAALPALDGTINASVADGDFLIFGFSETDGNGSTFVLDNISIQAVLGDTDPEPVIPEPASLALTSLGLAMLVSRRRCA